MGIINPSPHNTLTTNSLLPITMSGGTLTISPAGLQRVAEQLASLNRPMAGLQTEPEIFTNRDSDPMSFALNLTTRFISEGFTATTDVSSKNFYTPTPGIFNYFRSAVNGIGQIMKSGLC
jgi:hypothetical protein